jgi:hypothetical protein
MAGMQPPRLIAPYIRALQALDQVSEFLKQQCSGTSWRSAAVPLAQRLHMSVSI